MKYHESHTWLIAAYQCPTEFVSAVIGFKIKAPWMSDRKGVWASNDILRTSQVDRYPLKIAVGTLILSGRVLKYIIDLHRK
jgi:hypothetical protein